MMNEYSINLFFFFFNPVYPHLASVKLGSAVVWGSEAQGDGGATLPALPAALPRAWGFRRVPIDSLLLYVCLVLTWRSKMSRQV